ncbi:MAG: HK97 gp10 family phage protein [Pirellulaceae bacterium]
MIETSFNIEGGKELTRQLRALDKKMSTSILRSGLREGAKVVKTAAESKAPIDSGFLRDSIKIKTKKRGNKITAIIGFVEDAYYGRFLELGTKNMAAQPFLRPAIDENQRQAVDAAKMRMRKRIELQARKGRIR